MKLEVEIKQPLKIEKVWGYELWIHNNEEYCGKLLVFNNTGDKFSMHYHLKKKESWYVQQGSFIFSWLDVEDGKLISQIIKVGDSVTIERGLPHQLQAIDDLSTIYEVSTQHFNEDSYRIFRNTPMDLIGK
jgi:mannose-6-phosphate isomerase-like protein (cupin superfamily)